MNKTENPSAFPWANDADKQYNWIHRGMTLRDYFAAKAMQGLFLSGHFKGTVFSENTAEVAKVAYIMADAMLKAREA